MFKVFLFVALAAASAAAIPETAPVLPQYVIVAIGGETGGHHQKPHDTKLTEVYNVTTNKIKKAHKAPAILNQFGSVLVNNSTIYTLGGTTGSGGARVWSYDIVADKWNTNHPALPQAVCRPAVVVLNNVLYSIGGVVENDAPVNKIYTLDLKKGANAAWTTLKYELPFTGGDSCALTTSNGSILFYNHGRLVRSDDNTKTWKNLSAPIRDVLKGACALIDEDTILMAGGYLDNSPNVNGIPTAQIYSISKDKWSEAGKMRFGRRSASAVALPPGGAKSRKAVVCGGTPTAYSRIMHKSCEVYDANANTWQYGVPFALTVGRQDFGMHLAKLP